MTIRLSHTSIRFAFRTEPPYPGSTKKRPASRRAFCLGKVRRNIPLFIPASQNRDPSDKKLKVLLTTDAATGILLLCRAYRTLKGYTDDRKHFLDARSYASLAGEGARRRAVYPGYRPLVPVEVARRREP